MLARKATLEAAGAYILEVASDAEVGSFSQFSSSVIMHH